MRRLLVIALLLLTVAPAQAAEPDRRAGALVARMTLDEKIQLVHGITLCFIPIGDFPGSERSLNGDGFVPGIPRLGIPDVNYVGAGAGVTNCGARENGRSTVLPSPLARGSSWSPELAYDAGALLGTEARTQGFTTLLGGVSDLIREPRWGRAFETLGEDPVLNGALVAAELRGVQSRKVVATIKHYALNNQETGRETHDVRVDERTLRELHLLPYELAVPASGVGNVMCAYNRVNGAYACENDTLLNRILKGELGFAGQVQSDWGATHSTVPAALAGLDEEEFTSEFFGDALKQAVLVGSVPEARLDDMVRRKLRGLIAAGVLEAPPPAPGPVDAARDVPIAERLAEQTLVLLKNERDALPLSRSIRSIAVIGSHADVGGLSGGGSAHGSPVGGAGRRGLGAGVAGRRPGRPAGLRPRDAGRRPVSGVGAVVAAAGDPRGGAASDGALCGWRRRARARRALGRRDRVRERMAQRVRGPRGSRAAGRPRGADRARRRGQPEHDRRTGDRRAGDAGVGRPRPGRARGLVPGQRRR